MRDRALGHTIEFIFSTHNPDGGGVLVAPSSALVPADFAIYKNGSATVKTTTNGITVTSPFGSVTGQHKVSIDTSNNTGDAGFWASGSLYSVKLVTAKTAATYSLNGQPVLEFSLELQTADVRKFGGVAGTFAAGIPEAKVSSIAPNAVDAAALATDAVNEIQSGLLLAASYTAPANSTIASIYALLQLTDADVALVKIRTLLALPAIAPGIASGLPVLSAGLTVPAVLDSATQAQIDSIETDAAASVGYLTSLTTVASTISAKLGAFTATGLNTVLGALRAIAAKFAAGTPTDLSTGTTYDNTTDSMEAIRDRGDAAWAGGGGADSALMLATTIATVTSPTVLVLTAGSSDNDVYNDQLVIITDAVTSTQKAMVRVLDYVGSSKTLTLASTPGFVVEAGDAISIIAVAGVDLKPINDRLGWLLSQLVGTISNAGTADEEYNVTLVGVTYTVTHSGLDEDGNRGVSTLEVT